MLDNHRKLASRFQGKGFSDFFRQNHLPPGIHRHDGFDIVPDF